LLNISTQRDLNRLTFSCKLVDTLSSILDKEIIDLFQGEITGLRVTVLRVRKWKNRGEEGEGVLPEID
jgi:hypothetical protein